MQFYLWVDCRKWDCVGRPYSFGGRSNALSESPTLPYNLFTSRQPAGVSSFFNIFRYLPVTACFLLFSHSDTVILSVFC